MIIARIQGIISTTAPQCIRTADELFRTVVLWTESKHEDVSIHIYIFFAESCSGLEIKN